MQSNSILEDVAALRKAIWEKRPTFGGILDRHGNDFLEVYAKDFLDINSVPDYITNRRNELYDVVHEITEQRLNKTIADGLIRQFKKNPFVSTTDHHGIIDHPYWINSNILTALPYHEAADETLRYIPVFSFASVSLNNASAYPRGILFHGKNEIEEMIRLPFLPDKNKMSVVYAMRNFNIDDLKRSYEYLDSRIAAGIVETQRGLEIKEFVEKNIATPDVLQSKRLVEQITKVNYKIWPQFFHDAQEKPGQGSLQAPADLIYLEIERIIAHLLTRVHLKKTNSLIYKVLFGENAVELAKKYFDSLAGSFSVSEKWGTYFFWGMDEKFHRAELELIDGNLVSEKAHLSIPFTPEGIIEALEKENIFPNMFLCYVMIAFYYGFKCLGGFSQVHDLTVIKESWQRYLREIGEEPEADAIQPIQTLELSAGGIVLSYQEICDNCGLIPATGIDMYLDRRDTRFVNYFELGKKVSLMDMMMAMLPAIYSVLYSAPNRDERLANISPSTIMIATGVDATLRSYFKKLMASC